MTSMVSIGLSVSDQPGVPSCATPNVCTPNSSIDEDELSLAFAGGSIRAASACYGALRGFQQKHLTSPSTGETVSAMDLVKYNSGISGGSIPAVLYSYARVSTEELLETQRTTDPSMITPEDLSTMPETSMGFVLARKPKTRIKIIDWLIKMALSMKIFRVHNFWSAATYKKLFKPLNIPANKYFTSSKEELEKILQDNPRLKESDFLLPREGTKTLPMILFTMFGSRADNHEYEKNYRRIYDKAWNEFKAQETLKYFTSSFEEKRPNMTEIVLSVRNEFGSNLPMPYVATPDSVQNLYSGNVQVRKEVVEFPEKTVKPFEWGVRRTRFGVEHLVGMSTNFVGSMGSSVAQVITGLRKIRLSNNSAVQQRFADGGTNDVMGIIPLVQRRETKNIISVYIFNQNPPYTDFTESYADIYKFANATSLKDPDFNLHFQEWLKRMNPRFTCYFGFFNTHPIAHANIMNHIFHDPDLDSLKELMIKYNSLFEAGEPLIATMKDLKVIDNPFWGVKGGKHINLTLMYFNMPKTFSDNVPIEAVPPPEGMSKIDEHGRFNNEQFRMVPELPVEGTGQIKYTNEQVNMMGYLGSWMVDHSWHGLKGHDGEVKFEGFDKIFRASVV